ncbi:PREDICTED: alpha-1,3-mannosyl-glycoprotein 4-beta-N-acetylglucosaminyltransferase C-like [Cyprinodon variegatus]|uniref:Zgc:101663 n=1 Tax=Cyprinodon variegatus TaxID=28743 RepID=A0A3Q2FUH2_CYPVA|nr:PREDICTED: alpha-1,3-mannosyl-glycoprotein 4-beta-N-acetylglucosaminyltransferase C-like [Cyprinodon variegatus]
MRRRSRKKNVVLGALLLFAALYCLYPFDFLLMGLKSIASPVSRPVERLVSKDSWVEQGDFLPLNVTYQLLAGAPPNQQRFLTVGLSSVRRKKSSYLVSTLQSLFSQSSPEERSSMVVVVLLADFDVSWISGTLREINSTFPSELDRGQLLLIHVSQEWYPPLTGLKRNYNDAPDRVSFRSKQNVDYSFLIHFSAGLGRYYLQLEDDVLSAQNFLTTIRKRIEEQNAKKGSWAMLEFSALGYIGKLYRSSDLPLLARFLLLFYQEMPCDWLMTHFRELLTQRQSILFKPSLFQHIGTFSSFQGTYNKLKDKNFEEGVYTNPPAEVFTNISTYQKHLPRLAWEAGEEFFWGRSPERGDHLTVVFVEPTVVTGILVETGSGGKDLLDSGQLELGRDVKEKSCKSFQPIGEFKSGKFEMRGVDKLLSSASSCLRILVTASQKDWLIVRKIRITHQAAS